MPITIVRTNQYANKMRKIKLYLNGEHKGSIKNNEAIELKTDEKEIEIFAQIDWCKTTPIKVDLTQNENPIFELGCNISGLNALKNLYYVLFKTSEYIYLNKK